MRVTVTVDWPLPDVEAVAARAHDAWVQHHIAAGYAEHVADGENLMVPFAELSDSAKQAALITVHDVYSAIAEVIEDAINDDEPPSQEGGGYEHGD